MMFFGATMVNVVVGMAAIAVVVERRWSDGPGRNDVGNTVVMILETAVVGVRTLGTRAGVRCTVVEIGAAKRRAKRDGHRLPRLQVQGVGGGVSNGGRAPAR